MTREEATLAPDGNACVSELGAISLYLTYAARATGSYRPQLSQFFLAEVTDEQTHAYYLANKIVALGGEPTTVPVLVTLPDSNRGMLEEVLKAEQQATAGCTRSKPKSAGTRVSRCSSRTSSATRAVTSKKRSEYYATGRFRKERSPTL